MLRPIETTKNDLVAEKPPNHCPGDQQESSLSLTEACEQRISAREAYDAIIIGMLIVKSDCLGRPKSCPEAKEQLIAARKQLDIAEQNYLSAEERILYPH